MSSDFVLLELSIASSLLSLFELGLGSKFGLAEN
jgi:hypothetical protein